MVYSLSVIRIHAWYTVAIVLLVKYIIVGLHLYHKRQRRSGCRGRDPPPQYLTCRGRPVLTTPQIF